VAVFGTAVSDNLILCFAYNCSPLELRCSSSLGLRN